MKTSNLKMFLAFTVALFSASVFAQSSISGIITDETGAPISGVNVILEQTNKGAITDFDGMYTITNVDDGTYVLSASYIGYTNVKETVTVAGADVTANVSMSEDAESLDTVIVTGVTNPQSRIESSVSITSLKPNDIVQSAPRTTAEIFRTVPGIRSESSGGEGNANIAVRGVPVSSGGSKYVQLQEDGLPVLLFGDIAFGTADIFTRFDANISRIEAIRGGSASTLSSNSPGAIINLISKTGKTEGGSVATSFGLDYSNFRTDFEYGAPIGEGLYFHMGGFYRVGEGIRDAGYTANNGGQFKFNITKEFENGYVRLYTKYLNDRAIAYLPNPIQVTGTNDNPDFEDIPNFDANNETLHTPFLTQNVGLGESGQLRRSNVTDGMHPVSISVGMEASFELAEGWRFKNNGRFSFNKGGFNSPFPASVQTAGDFLAGDFATGNGYATLAYQNGGLVPDNALITPIVLFDTQLNNFNNFMNDLRLTKKFDMVNVTLGYFKANQNVKMSWLWNSYLLEASGNNARLINANDADGNRLTDNGLVGYGAAFFGNCCQRSYDTQYTTSAPYLAVGVQATENLNFDGSIRFDYGKVDGSFAGPVTSVYDVNNDGEISLAEQTVQGIDLANPTIVNYNYDYVSYSLGANYLLKENEAVFARYSRGGSAKADRILFAGLNYLDGDQINALDFINQAEVGYKRGFGNGSLYATAFYAKTIEEGGFEATTQQIIENDYRSFGIELEGSYRWDNLEIRGGVTYTNADIDSGDNEGNTPRRQPDFIYNLIPSYNFGGNKQHSFGLSVIGQTKAYAQDSNELVLPGFVIVNSFINYEFTTNLAANISANNLFDTLGITESEEGSIVEGQTNYIRVRPVPGRSISMGVTYKF
ncbi:TonB-dependent receptor [Marinirhabdus gelatinilytica]|uniref:Outer membrane receptor protein involved in Fe transport n=1 Tax=Marinirhabdus gelatinilytica TaxID=1703343 RepID=A0A370QB57_9FLAO|nr:TonB-dependent receptor [Marinirhabdus gelatinilytica]RDK85230.1 outer membrane receptor protein involved in Fe transport [Marinirhabdus gelatinilytica]